MRAGRPVEMAGDRIASVIAEAVVVAVGKCIGGSAAVDCMVGADCTVAETSPASADTMAAEVRHCCSQEPQVSSRMGCHQADHLCWLMAGQGRPQDCTAEGRDSGLDSHTSEDCTAASVAAATAARTPGGYKSEAGMSEADMFEADMSAAGTAAAAAVDRHIRLEMKWLVETDSHPGMRHVSAAQVLLLELPEVARTSAGLGIEVARTALRSLRFARVPAAVRTDRDTAAGLVEIAGTARSGSKTLWRLCDIRIGARWSVELAIPASS